MFSKTAGNSFSAKQAATDREPKGSSMQGHFPVCLLARELKELQAIASMASLVFSTFHLFSQIKTFKA